MTARQMAVGSGTAGPRNSPLPAASKPVMTEPLSVLVPATIGAENDTEIGSSNTIPNGKFCAKAFDTAAPKVNCTVFKMSM